MESKLNSLRYPYFDLTFSSLKPDLFKSARKAELAALKKAEVTVESAMESELSILEKLEGFEINTENSTIAHLLEIRKKIIEIENDTAMERLEKLLMDSWNE